MLIGICGSPCSGKHTVVRYLVDTYAFRYLSVHNRNTVDIHRDELTDEQRIDFNDVKEMEQFVTKRWREDFVTCHVGDAIAFEKFRKRPFFLLVAIEAPIIVRYHRFQSRQIYSSSNLESFALHNDHTVFGMPLELHSASSSPSSSPKRLSVHTLTSLADLIILNPYLTLPPLHAHLLSIDLINPERLRPTWDTYFMHLSDLAARRSNCMKRRVGCILVKDLRVIATGYNGTPRGMRNCNEGGCKRCNEAAPCQTAMDKCLCMHAEENALLEAGKERVMNGSEAILYCCAIKIVQVGIREVVYSRAYGMDELTVRVFAEAGVRLRQHSSPAYGEVQVDLEAQRSMGGVGVAEPDCKFACGSQLDNLADLTIRSFSSLREHRTTAQCFSMNVNVNRNKELGISSDILHHWLKQEKIIAKISLSGIHLYDIFFLFSELTFQNAESITITTTIFSTTTFSIKKSYVYRKITLNIRNNFSSPDSQLMNSSVTLAQISTSDTGDLKLY
ncbi:hypothetical protein BC936DRAFT_147295 [Jimgerdemannia flammicorona]|uniref:Deoxycytidylate deaminase n=1 Tax=Jimgerdemannia flammicorona TaxID=994334 RepID=A0A433D5P3_9FUNG|nr:hypothetical protein BC936DRAFT_147295 [Jimgerdemannia flammicorona]